MNWLAHWLEDHVTLLQEEHATPCSGYLYNGFSTEPCNRKGTVQVGYRWFCAHHEYQGMYPQ